MKTGTTKKFMSTHNLGVSLIRFEHNCRYIAFNAVSCGTFDVVYAAIHPEALFPASVVVIGGIFKDTFMHDFTARLVLCAALIPLGGVIGSILAMVAFRYAHHESG